jgi:hypothetical protein
MDDDTTEPFGFPAVGRKKLAAAFDGGRLTSDGGVMLLAAVDDTVDVVHGLQSAPQDRHPVPRRGGRRVVRAQDHDGCRPCWWTLVPHVIDDAGNFRIDGCGLE